MSLGETKRVPGQAVSGNKERPALQVWQGLIMKGVLLA
jgi:hypothetical protein